MSSIIKTAMTQDTHEKGIKLRSLEVTYLSGQGVVFEVNSNVQNRKLGFLLGDDSEFVLGPDVPGIPPLPMLGEEVLIELEEGGWSDLLAASLRIASGALNETTEKLRELQSQEREIAWEQREYERRLRDIEFEMRNADTELKNSLKEQKSALDVEITTLKKRQEEVNKYAKQIEDEQKQKVEQKLAQRKQQLAVFLTRFEDNIATTLCKYGNGINALPMDENLSFVLSKLGSSQKGGTEDRIYVFKNKDIQSCVKDKITPTQLLKNADIYMF